MNKPHRDEYVRARTALNSALMLLEYQNSDFSNQHVERAIKALERAISLFDDELEKK